MRGLHECLLGVVWVLTDGRNSRFLLSRHQLRVGAARHAAAAEFSTRWRGNAVSVTSILDRGQFF